MKSMPSTAPSHPKSAYRPDIDGLRAVAISIVVVNHFFRDALPGGFIGVDVFFVISGFLITGIISEELKDGSFSLGQFYARRARRLFPALATVLVSLVIVGCLILSPEELALLGKHVAASAGFVINIVLLRENGYFDLASDLKPLLHMWSLSVEEQFYLLWPFVLLLAVRLRLELLALTAIAVGSLYLNLSTISKDAVRVFFSPEFRAWEFAVGGLLALQMRSSKFRVGLRSPLFAETTTILGLCLIGGSALLFDARALYPGWRAILPVLGAVLLLAAGGRSRIASYLLGNPVSRYIGHISYPLYLWHWPVVALLTIMVGPPSYPMLMLALPVAILLAVTTYHLIEAPVRTTPWLFRGRDIRVEALSATLVAVALVGLCIAQLGGLTWRVIDYKAPIATDYVFVDEACRALAGEQFNYCRMGKATKAPTIALLGDSHANHFYDGVAAYAARYNESVINLGGCLPLPNTAIYQEGTVDGCLALGRAQLDFAMNSPDIHTILMAGRFAYWTAGTGVNGLENGRTRYVISHPVEGGISYGLDAFEAGLRAMIAEVSKSGKRLIIILDNPELDFPPAACLSQRPFNLFQRHDCSIPRSAVEKRQQPYRAVVVKMTAENPALSTFDPMSVLCDANRCFAMVGDKLLYRDDNHLSQDGSLHLADHYKFLPRIESR